MQSERKQNRRVNPGAIPPAQPRLTDRVQKNGKKPWVESGALEAELAAEVEHGQLSSDELNSSNDN